MAGFIKLFLITALCIFSFTKSSSQTGWFGQTSGNTFYLGDVKMISSSNAVVSFYCPDCYSRIYLTTNSGQSWNLMYTTSNPLDNLNAVSFVNSNTGVVVGGGYFNSGSLILRSTNGGTSWALQTSPVNNALYDVSMLSTGVGLAVGYNGIVIKTTDGGTTWNLQTSNTAGILYGVSMMDANTGVSVGAAGTIIRTINGGTNWNTIASGTGRKLSAVSFINLNNGIAVGDTGTILYSSNGGVSWAAQTSGTALPLNNIIMADINRCFAVGNNGLILRTTNSGTNWQVQNSNTSNHLLGVSFIDTVTGTAVGYTGTILRTTNGGITFIETVSNEIPLNYSLSQNYPNPFNPSTNFEFRIADFGWVQLKIYDINGREITALVNEELKTGIYKAAWDASNYPSGVYFYKLAAGDAIGINNTGSGGFTETKKMILIK